ncbi:glycosyltransferase family 4 protein [Facklamia sp. P9177]|uniref:glycosyltransferase family 4 protein n=1 Tax=Facklamia sp. P9177 TaxID=3421945 RepID=UPI003D1689AD
MNILFLTLNFKGINNPGLNNDLIRYFKNMKHNIYVISANERKEPKQEVFKQIENLYSLKVRIPNITKTNIIEKGISTLFIERLYMRAIKKHLNNIQFDLVLYTTPPITFSKVVEYIKKRDAAKTYLMLKDIFPQNAVDIQMIKKSSFLYKYFRRKEKKLYDITDFIGTMSKKNKEYIIRHNVEIEGKVEILPNTITPRNININLHNKNVLFKKYHIPLNKRTFIYGGNLGKPQGIDFVIECIKRNEQNKNSFIVIVGSGTEFSKLEKAFEEYKFRNALLLNQLPKKKYELLANSCDVGLIFLDYRFTIPNFPSRLLSYMQASMPIIAATDPNTDIGDVIEENGFGRKVLSNDVEKFNQIIQDFSTRSDLKEMGRKARSYLEKNYTSETAYNTIMKHFE